MIGVLLLLFLLVPVIELYVIVQVGQALGVLPALALLVAISVVGAWLVKREGLGVWRRAQQQMQRGELPTNELIDGVLVLLAGALMLTPGFVTDVAGLLLLLPPTRALARGAALRRSRDRLRVMSRFTAPGGAFVTTAVYDVEHVGDVTPPVWRSTAADTPRELGGR